MSNAICHQPHCALRREGMCAEGVAELALLALSGRTARAQDAEPIEPRPVCLECIRRVMAGRGPFPTPTQHARDEHVARWSHRRERRARLHG